MTKSFSIHLFFLLFLAGPLVSCNRVSVGYLDANVIATGDVTGSDSVRARINFTDFIQPPGPGGNDEKLRALLTNSDGDSMTIVLSPVNGTFPTASYTFDGSTHTFETSFTVTFASGPQSLTLGASGGFINLTGINIDTNGIIQALTAELHVNLEGGGAAVGSITFSRS